MTATQACPTVGEIVAANPNSARFFEKLGIDFCCGGKVPLDAACAEKKIDPNTLLKQIEAGGFKNSGEDAKDWLHAPISELCAHIEQTHHAYLKTELPRLAGMAEKVARVHGEHNPKLIKLHAIFDAFRAELEQHMFKEEMILFPLCRALEQAQVMPPCHCGSVRNPISVMEQEHSHAGDAMEKFRELTDNYTAPDWACGTYRVLLKGLEDLEKDMHLHVHKENNILFPRAVKRESELQ
ncbi:MAG TPA: iron-sulfur cluster repair di-iron protein [Planctomycetota bacterium]|nr:iron-sulfur cluster repair di-iron protein [Planctomycetota bacterium]